MAAPAGAATSRERTACVTAISADVSFCGAFGVSMRNSRRFVCSLPTLRPTSAISSITYRATNATNDSCSTPSAAALPEA